MFLREEHFSHCLADYICDGDRKIDLFHFLCLPVFPGKLMPGSGRHNRQNLASTSLILVIDYRNQQKDEEAIWR